MISSSILAIIMAVSANYDSYNGQCPETKLVGFNGSMTEQDIRSLKSAKTRCVYYYPDAPCLKIFERREEGVYRAICGAISDTKAHR